MSAARGSAASRAAPEVDRLFIGVAQLVTPAGPGAKRGPQQSEVHVLGNAAVGVRGGQVVWLGPADAWRGAAHDEVDLGGRAVVPGLVDPHTHLLWAGDRYDDLDDRLAGVSYQRILRRGGGIRSTVRATASASQAELLRGARARLADLAASGATTVEVKSGYGGSVEAELASLEAIAALRAEAQVRVVPTLLVHVPDTEDRQRHLRAVIERLVPEVATRGLATRIDVFVEHEAFSVAEAERILLAGRAQGLDLTLHADQFRAIGGVDLAVRLGARSVDHLEAAGVEQIDALAQGTSVATLLPGASLELGLAPAPGRALIDAGVAVALATDLNPGSSPIYSSALALALGVRVNRLRPAEALVAATANAAAALGLRDVGWLGVGARADLLVLPEADWRCLAHGLGGPGPLEVWAGGARVERLAGPAAGAGDQAGAA
jgi:imidazolonepropionase